MPIRLLLMAVVAVAAFIGAVVIGVGSGRAGFDLPGHAMVL